MARHLNLLTQKLLDVADGRCKRLMVFMPPRHGKSELCSHFFPAWYLGNFPQRQIILASYGADLATSFGRKARDVLTEFGPSVFGVTLKKDSLAANRWETTQGGIMVTAGVGGPITGRGANILLIDDPVENAEQSRSITIRERAWDWYRSTAYTRLEPEGAIVLIMTRWNEDDLAGRLLKKAQEDGEPWEILRLPAIAGPDDQLGRQPGEALWPARFPLERLEEIRRTTEAYWWSALFDQNPQPEGGTEWPVDYFGPDLWFSEWPTRLRFKVLALDPSKGKNAKFGDYSAFVMAGVDDEGKIWIDCTQEVIPTPKIVQVGIGLVRDWHPEAFVVETNLWQELLAAEFLREANSKSIHLPIWGINNSVNKEVRIRRLGPWFHQKKLRLKGDSKGCRLLVEQARQFPAGAHDDGLDSLEMAIRMIRRLAGQRGDQDAPETVTAV